MKHLYLVFFALFLCYHASAYSFVGYFQTWSSRWVANGSNSDLANLPAYVTHVMLSFAKPDMQYSGGLSLSGTGLDFSYDGPTVFQAIKSLHQRNPGVKVMLSVGGATYTNWAGLNSNAVSRFVKDFQIDGVDIDFEPSTPNCQLGADKLIHCTSDTTFNNIVKTLRGDLPRGQFILALAGFSVGAYGEGQWAGAQPPSQYTGLLLDLFRTGNGALIDLISVMSYDAGPTYDPNVALAAYQNYFRGIITMGVEVPPEAWGGHVYTIAQVQALAQQVKSKNAGGMMLWSIQKQPNGSPSQNNPSATMMAQTVCNQLALRDCTQSLPTAEPSSKIYEKVISH